MNHRKDEWRKLYGQGVADFLAERVQKGLPDYKYLVVRSSPGISKAVISLTSHLPHPIARLALRLLLTAFIIAAWKPASSRLFIPFSVLPPGTHTFLII